MKLLGKDCGCERRAEESGISNPFRYWLWHWPLRQSRRALYALLSLSRDLRPLANNLLFGDHLTIVEGELTARVIRADGSIEHYNLGKNTIGDAAVTFLRDDFNNGGQDISTMNFHAWGTGACATPPACVTTNLVTEATEARVAGTRSVPAANQFRTVATITADGTKTITEWKLASAGAGGTAWSLRCFAGISVVLNDAIEFTYTLTITCVTG
jgi:hypothetical protein